MGASTVTPRTPAPPNPIQPDAERLKRSLLQNGVFPTPILVHPLRNKEPQKRHRKSKHIANLTQSQPTYFQNQALDEESGFPTLAREHRGFTKAVKARAVDGGGAPTAGKPWERSEKLRLRELAGGSGKECAGEKPKAQHLRELGHFLEQRRDVMRRLLDGDIVVEQSSLENGIRRLHDPVKQRRTDADAIRLLIDRLSATDLSLKDWKFSKMMKQSGLAFTERQLLKIVGALGTKGQWKHALSIVEWLYSSNDHKHDKSRFVFTKLLAVLGKARRPDEALHLFNLMREDCQIYPDMPAYHSIAVTLGQAGLLKQLLKIIEYMKQKPSKKIKNMRNRNWDPILEPDVVVFNAVLNACVPSQQWKGVFWVFEQIRKRGLKPNGATFGLAMEVMLHSGKYDLVHRFFEKMTRSGEALKAVTYKVLVRAYWKEGKVNEAVGAVRDMEQRGVVGAATVYYELACCLCYHGRWQHAMVEVEKLIKLPHIRQLEVTFTGMIMSAMDGGHIDDCIFIFEHLKGYCDPNIGTINAMLKVYGQHDMFSKAKELFEETKRSNHCLDSCTDGGNLIPDVYTYIAMLEACARALQWEYFVYAYREMTLSGYQLDQSKHVPLLVQASRAGKCHLLEHAFDSILEAGEIPHLTLFTEMVCQAISQQNYERAISLVCSMAYAPFQVSEEQWTDLFGNNRDRISVDSLHKLLVALCKLDEATEATTASLFRSLQSLCGSGPSDNKSLPNDNIAGFDGNKRENAQNLILAGTVGNGPDTEEDIADTASKQTSNDECDDDIVAGDAASDHCTDKWSTSVANANVECEADGELDLLTGDIDDLQEYNLPSANEILAAWKDSKKDETCSLSQLYQK